jgi:hypothetical protein
LIHVVNDVYKEMKMGIRGRLLASIVVAGSALMVWGPMSITQTAQASTVQPHIAAHPNNLMVNTYTRLTGTGFPPDTTITIEDCGQTAWIAVQNPCTTGNTITVLTDPAGGFVSGFKAELCPRTHIGPGPVNRAVCYIGEPKPSGVDTINLVGAAKIIVTYP